MNITKAANMKELQRLPVTDSVPMSIVNSAARARYQIDLYDGNGDYVSTF